MRAVDIQVGLVQNAYRGTMDAFTDILRQATASIEPAYFHLPIDGGDPVYRERVYCYELYHQMRALWPENCEYFLNGEVDKGGHPCFQDQGAPKPDFIVHVPGTGNNYAAIEVKTGGAAAKNIRKDVETLLTFLGLGYQRALYIVYGCNPGEARDRIAGAVEDPGVLDAFELWIHHTVGEPAVMVKFDEST